MRFQLKPPSPAMAVACTSLFVAFGGSGYAASQLPVTAAKKPTPIKAIVRSRPFNFPSGNQTIEVTVAVPCKAGERAVGGGATPSDATGDFQATLEAAGPRTGPANHIQPATSGDKPTAWSTTVRRNTATTAQLYNFYAVCVSR